MNQKEFFESTKHQYLTKLIRKPPTHTALEIHNITHRLGYLKKDDVVLDFGAGSGRISIPLLKEHRSVVSVDISKKSLTRLKRTAESMSLTKRLKTTSTIPTNVSFGAIVGADILHHIDMNYYLPLFKKALRKGGKVIFSEPCAFNPSWYIFLPFASSWNIEKGLMSCSYFNLKKKFKKFGFDEVTITGLGLLPRPFFMGSRSMCKINDTLGNVPLLKLFAYRYIIEATKN